MEHDLYLISVWHKREIYNFDPYNVLLAIATNMLLMTGFVVQGHIYYVSGSHFHKTRTGFIPVFIQKQDPTKRLLQLGYNIKQSNIYLSIIGQL